MATDNTSTNNNDLLAGEFIESIKNEKDKLEKLNIRETLLVIK